MEHGSQRQSLLPLPAIHHDDSAYTLQVSRRPSILLQEILTNRPPGIGRKDPNNFFHQRSSKNAGYSWSIYYLDIKESLIHYHNS